ncbi:GAF domain-containing protein [Microbacterium sp. K2]|uniref:GAF domain-containing protein n=1 Tax=Microbacterium sp. K2 TaxID=3391827 RepID=UPI003EDB5F9F
MSPSARASSGDDTPSVYRAPMRSRDGDVPDGPAVERALALGVCGVGGRLDDAPDSIAEALAAVDEVYGERMARRLDRFASVAEGAFVWTRDSDGLLWLGRITGPWRYDPSPQARAVDLPHVRAGDWLDRPVEPVAPPHVRAGDWLDQPVAPAAVPPGVRESFARGGRNWQSISRADAARLTAAVWSSRRGR